MNTCKKIALLAAMASCLACNKEIEVSTQNSSVKTLTIEAYNAETGTKTLLDEFGSVLWNPNDSITVFFGDYSVPFYSYNSKPATRANFIGTALVTTGNNAEYDGSSEEYEYWGVYPYQTHQFKYIPLKYEGGVACFVDESQTATEDTFDRSTFVTVARSRDYSKLAFYNLCGGVRFKLSSSDIETVTFTGNNNEALAGEVVVDMDADGHPYARKHYSEIKTIRLSAPKGTTFKAGVWYYLVSLPSELSAGFTMKFISKSQSKMAVLKTNAPVSIERSHFGSLDCPDANLEYTQYDGSEEKAQLRVELYIKSVKMAEDESFSVELGFPTIAAQKVCEKVEFKVNYFTDLNNPNSIPQKIGSTLYCVGIGYDRINYNKYDNLSVDEQILFNNLRQHRPSKVFYSSKSHTFISVDQSDKNMYNMAHSIFGRYLGSCDNNNYFHLPPVNGSGELLSEGNKIYNILDNEDKLILLEWGDYNSLLPAYPAKLLDIWLVENLYPAVFIYDSSDNYIMATFPGKGVMNKIVIPENSDTYGEFPKTGKTKYWVFEDYSVGRTAIRHLTTENGIPVAGEKVLTNRHYYLLQDLYELSKYSIAILGPTCYDESNGGIYYKLSEGGNISSHVLPQDFTYGNEIGGAYAMESSGFVARVYYTKSKKEIDFNENEIKLLKYDFVSDTMTRIDNISIPDHIGSLTSTSGRYKGHVVIVLRMIQSSDEEKISFIINCESGETFIEQGDIQLEQI